MQKLHKVLKDLNACKAAIKWAGNRNVSKASWDACERGDWILWLAIMLDIDRKPIIAALCDIVAGALDRHWHNDNDNRPAECIRITRLWIEDKATLEDVGRARERAIEAAIAADDTVASYIANVTVDVAAVAIIADAIIDVVADDAVEVAADADVASAFLATGNARRDDSYRYSAVIVRKHIPFNIIKDAIGKM